MSFNPLAYDGIWMWPARRTNSTSWHEHIPLAFTLGTLLRPHVFVELGTNKGDSYFAFCQAVERFHDSTRCYAVDTWSDDGHTGGDNVFYEVRWYNEAHYSSFSTLLRMTFDEALGCFDNGQIDLLHIYGPDTYDEARHHFDAWMPKMSGRGVVLLHGIAAESGDGGIRKLWEEIKMQFPSFQFSHSSGLGIVAVGPEIPAIVATWVHANDEEASRIRRFYTYLGEAVTHRAKPLCSIVIPQYGHAELTIQCIQSLQQTLLSRYNYEIIVVDDGSEDESATKIKAVFGETVRVVEYEPNLGFASACNRGASATSGTYLVFLNNDTITQQDWLGPMLRAIQDPQNGLIGAKLIRLNGSVQHAGVWFHQTEWGPLTALERQGNSPQAPELMQSCAVPAVTGACVLVRRDDFFAVSGFDETYPNDLEDTDLCLKIAQKGLRIWYEASAEIIHIETATRGRTSDRYPVSSGIFYRKWLSNGFFNLKLADPREPSGGDRPTNYIVWAKQNRPRAWQAIQTIAGLWTLQDRLVLIDGGSTDGTRELMENIARNNPAIVRMFSSPTFSSAPEMLSWVFHNVDLLAHDSIVWVPQSGIGNVEEWKQQIMRWRQMSGTPVLYL
ncbi:Glycosyltransferase, GT2 family [Sulfobacillus thermosulfidooxidans DSM 9293]|uniref:Glycosyltransferase, GT2 family n=1 Tax=Sulfobacillus thermosulfidooxidans (strain DSM 9293 / VKM B-1269 / AT-1) TaxID=929705 RepID=A0A1W1WCA8_SULTA|nr:glycosyltransferase [Sulfobacillus thermosulfidooxidans]SMC03917.1 Glycosyltransferase, GT2 family [Sulfobacillus thermosulfidooxidans DSM 9293]